MDPTSPKGHVAARVWTQIAAHRGRSHVELPPGLYEAARVAPSGLKARMGGLLQNGRSGTKCVAFRSRVPT
jgi:hypothetical protein